MDSPSPSFLKNPPLRVALVSMPFANVHSPSLGLTKLKAVVAATFGPAVHVDILYLACDYAKALGCELYDRLSKSYVGLALMRRAAFPDQPDTLAAFLPEMDVQADQFPMFDDMARRSQELIEPTIDRYRLDRYHVVGFTSLFAQHISSLAMAKHLKARSPDIITLIGGTDCFGSMGQVTARKFEAFDFVFSGPALKTLPLLLTHLLNNQPHRCHDIHGVFSRQKLDRLRQAGQPKPDEIGPDLDINTLVELDYDEYFHAIDAHELQLSPNSVTLPFQTSHGCWWGQNSRCSFCGFQEALAFEAMRPDLAVQHLRRLFRYHTRATRFDAIDAVVPSNYLTQVFPHLDAPANVRLFYEVRPTLTLDQVRAMTQARVNHVRAGIESLSTPTLKWMRKGVTAFDNIRFLKHCLQGRLLAMWNILIGSPGESDDVYEKYLQDLPWLIHLQPPDTARPLLLTRFSPYLNAAAQYGVTPRADNLYRLIYPLDEEDLNDLAYVFQDTSLTPQASQHRDYWLGKLNHVIRAWRRAWWQSITRPPWRQPQDVVVPVLEIRRDHDQPFVFDSRGGRPTRVDLSPLARQLLRRLEEPHRVESLADRFPDVDPREVADCIKRFRRHHLLFEEGPLAMSLVIHPDAPALSCETALPDHRLAAPR